MAELLYKTNPFQTPITQEYLDTFPDEVVADFWDYVNNVPFIKTLISEDRKYAKDLERDEDGKIIVDLVNPHILTDMDYFRESAIHFQKHGVYTKLKLNTHPLSQYMQWYKREVWRCWYGMVRESDGEWIPGELYFYLNYFPIIQTKIVTKGKARYGKRIIDFPEVWEGIYWRYHYWEQAKKGGMYNDFMGNQHAVEIAKRGAAHPYSQKVITPDGVKLWKDITVGSRLFGTSNNITTVTNIPFDEEYDVYKVTLKDGREVYSSLEHLWNVTKYGGVKELNMTLPLKDIMSNYKQIRKVSPRNPSGVEYVYSIPKNEGVEFTYQLTKVDPYTMGLLLGDGTFSGNWTNRVGFSMLREDYNVIRKYIPYEVVDWKEDTFWGVVIENCKGLWREYKLSGVNSPDRFIPDEFKYNSREVRLNILKGLMDSDGSVEKRGVPTFTSTSKQLVEDVQFIARSLGYNCSYTIQNAGYKKDGVYIKCNNVYILMISTKDNIFNLPRKSNIMSKFISNYSRSRMERTRIINIEFSHREMSKCVTVDSEDSSYLIGDFIQTHNSKSYSVGSRVLRDFVLGIDLETVEKVKSLVVAYNKEYLMKDGTLNKVMDGMDHLHKTTQFPSAKSKNAPSDMHWVSGWTDTDGFSRGSQNEIFGISISDDPDKIRGKRSNLVVYEEYAAFSKFLDTWQVALPNVQEGSLAFGQNIGIATGGSEGSDFAGALEMIMYPRGYNIYALPNVHDKGASGKRESLFFFPGYVNVKGFYNSNGVSDVVAAMFDELVFRHTLKYNSSDPVQLARRKSETAFTIQDAIMKTDSTIYPVADINDRINKIDNTPEITSSMYVGRLEIKDKQIVWVPDPDVRPIMNFPHKDNSLKGCVYIKEHPIKDSTGNVPWGRYISGADTIDTDGAQTLSLFSCYILDLWTDEIVAEYTGREAMVEDSFEIYRRLLIYYQAQGNYENNKKGLFAHFSKYNSLTYLSGQLEYLRDVENVRITFGNASKGTPSSKPIKQYGRIFIRDYLLSPVQTVVENINEHGETYEETITIPRVHTICFRALLQELSMHNLDGNFDRHDALVMLMLLREEHLRLLGDSTFERRHADAEKDYLGDSDFFEKNYGTTNYNEDQLERLKQLGLMEA